MRVAGSGCAGCAGAVDGHLCHQVVGFRIGDVYFDKEYLGDDHIVFFLQKVIFLGEGGAVYPIQLLFGKHLSWVLWGWGSSHVSSSYLASIAVYPCSHVSAPSDFGWFCAGDSLEQNRGRVREAGHWRVSFRSKHTQTNMGHRLRLSSFLLGRPQG
ncbi:hypothetical protein CTA2_2347 [Colletotrichum tanaceti]|uniref:Uncharacterized protein n=1 Tax=Colletotrichum tanaceti TaxID=1306861 RepID=A0A4U6XE47_9PEZI|nr:hypothetical protein CTA2_2347 [Colletotrichum tanaceti]TKW53653.1 hypothetical protein CTA1_6945 [Colletotrichum tanaceti]